jgi:hypothetical protein
LRYHRLPDARRQATPEWPIDNPGVDRPENSTGAGGANNTGVTRELHGYFGPFARANIQVFHLVYDDDQHFPSSIHPVKVAIATATVFVALSDSEKNQIFIVSDRVS